MDRPFIREVRSGRTTSAIGANAAAKLSFSCSRDALKLFIVCPKLASCSASVLKPSLIAFLSLLNRTNRERIPRPYFSIVLKPPDKETFVFLELRPMLVMAFPSFFRPLIIDRFAMLAKCIAAFFAASAILRIPVTIADPASFASPETAFHAPEATPPSIRSRSCTGWVTPVAIALPTVLAPLAIVPNTVEKAFRRIPLIVIIFCHFC